MKRILPYALALIFCGYLIFSLVEVIEVTNSDMEPLILTNQKIIGIKSEHFEKNNIVIVNVYSDNKIEKVAKRVYGVTGDKIDIEGNTVKVNENVVKVLNTSYAKAMFILKSDEYLLLGDAPDTTWVVVDSEMISSRLEGVK